MPNFIFPLLYRNKALTTHNVIMMCGNPLITGGEDGDIVIWDEQLNVRTLIYPNLSHSYGRVIWMSVVKIPFFNILDCVDECLVTLHQDMRVRVFDINDGRCISVSNHDCFKEVIQEGVVLQKDRCRYLCFMGVSKLYLFDIWKMKCVKDYEGKFKAMCVMDINSISILDVDNQLHILNISPLNTDRYLNYFEYCKKKKQIDEEWKEMKLADGLIIQSLKYIPTQEKVVWMHYHNEQLCIAMKRQIWLIFYIHGQAYYLNIAPSKLKRKFVAVHQSNGCLWITCRDGAILQILMKDIHYMLEITKEIEDFVYGFKEFQFTKIAGTRFARIQMNMQSYIQGDDQGNRKLINATHIHNDKVYQSMNGKIFVYQIGNDDSFQLFMEQQTNILFQGFKLYFNSNSILAQIEDITTYRNTITITNLKQYDDGLLYNLKQMWTPFFKSKFNLEQDLQHLSIHSAFIDIDSSIYYFGCQNGTIYGFPTTFQGTNYNILLLQFDSTPVKFIYQKGKHLIASAQSGKFIISNVNSLQQVQLYTILKVEKEYTFTSAALRLLRIYKLDNESYFDEDQQQIMEETHQMKMFKMAVQLENNVVIIICLESGEVQLKLYGIKENVQLYGLYHDVQGDYWFVITEEGVALMYDGKGRYRRTINLEQYHSLFQVEKKLMKAKEKMIHYHKFSNFIFEFNKSVSQVNHYLEYSQRNSFMRQQAPYPNLYEVGGKISGWEFDSKEAIKILYLIDHHSSKSTRRTCKFVQTIIGEMEWWDLKKQINVASDLSIQNRLFIMIHPWEADPQIDAQLDGFLQNQRPVFSPIIGIQSMGYAISFPMTNPWSTSEYVTSMRSMSLMHYYHNFIYKDAQLFNNLMVQTVELLTRKQNALDPHFKPMNIMVLSNYIIDEQNEVMTAACNLILSCIKKGEQQKNIQPTIREILDLEKGQSSLSNVEVICLVIDAYIGGLSERSMPANEELRKKYLSGIHLKTCLLNPHLCAPLLKVLVDVLQYFRATLNLPDLLKDLFMMFFNYNTVLEYMESVKDQQNMNIKGHNILKEIAKQPDDLKRRMKQLIIKAIIHLANVNIQEFSSIIRKDIVNLEIHPLYPCSIIDIIRQFIKSQQNNAIKHLPFLMEIILKSLDPNNPNLRRVCHRPATSALQTICKTYKCVSFHQSTQKIALGSTENQIIIYDLRTAVKWRVFDGHEGQVTALEFDHTGKQLASFSKADQKIKVWKVGAAGYIYIQPIQFNRFFGSILGIQGRPVKEIQVKKFESPQVSIQWHQEDRKVQIVIIIQQSYLFSGDVSIACCDV